MHADSYWPIAANSSPALVHCTNVASVAGCHDIANSDLAAQGARFAGHTGRGLLLNPPVSSDTPFRYENSGGMSRPISISAEKLYIQRGS